MAITFRSSSTAASGSAVTTLNVTKPSGVVNNDVMVAFVTIGGDQTITGVPTGWLHIGTQTTGSSTGDCRHGCYYKVASGEGASYSWDFSGAVDCAIAIVAYSGASTTTPVNYSNYSLNSSSTLTLTAPSVNPSVTNTMVLYGFGCNSGVTGNLTFTPQSGLTARAEADPEGSTTNRAAVAVFSEPKSSTATEGTKTCTIDDTAKGVSWALVLASSSAEAQSIILETVTETSSTEGCMLGWYDGSNSVDEALARASELDTHWAAIRLYNSPQEFPTIKTTKTAQIIAAGALPVVSHKPPNRGGAWIEIHRGDHSASIDAWVAYYKSLAPTQIIFIFNHEPHDNTTDLKPDDPGNYGTASDFVKAYRYIGNKFRAANADNVLLGYSAVANTWAIKKASGSNVLGSGDKCWPGSDLVDVLCHDEYNTVGTDSNPNPGGGASGTIAFVGGTAKATAKGVNSITFNLTGVQAGDLLLANLQTDYTNMDHTQSNGFTLAGWREESTGSNPDSNDPPLTGGTDLCGYVFYKFANGGETSVTFDSDSSSTSSLLGGAVTVWRGVDTSNPIYDIEVSGQTTGNTVECPSVNGLSGGALVCHFIKDDDEVMNPVSGMTTVGGFPLPPPPASDDDYGLITYKLLTTTGSTGVKSSSYIDEGDARANDMGWSVSLKPAGSGLYDYSDRDWKSFETEYSETVQLAKLQNKPLIFGEIGSNHSIPGGSRDEWFRDGATWIKNSEDARNFLKGFCYYHVDSHGGSGHYWRFTYDSNTMFKGDGALGFTQGMLQDAYFKTEPFDVLTGNVETSTQGGGISSVEAFGNPTATFSTVGATSIQGAGGIASPSDYDLIEELPGSEFGTATLTMPGVIIPTGIASTLAFGTLTLSRHSVAGYYFTPPVSSYTGGTLANSYGTQHSLFRYYRGAAVSNNVYLMLDGTITETPEDVNAVATIYHGGHTVTINDEEEALLRDAGYGAYITAAPGG